MDRVFIYWDNANIFVSVQEVAAEREGPAPGGGCGLISAICWNWRTPAERLNTRWPSAQSRRN